MNNETVIKKLKGVQSDKIILDILCDYLDKDIVEEIKTRRLGVEEITRIVVGEETKIIFRIDSYVSVKAQIHLKHHLETALGCKCILIGKGIKIEAVINELEEDNNE